MILLSEVAEKIHTEIHSWPGSCKGSTVLQCAGAMNDARSGDERLLTEVLGILVGLSSNETNPITLSIDGDDEIVRITVSPLCGGEPDWPSLQQKASTWSPTLTFGEESVTLELKLPASVPNPPVDLKAMAGETGIGINDAMIILKGFLDSGRNHLEILKQESADTDWDKRYRAAHSLKGAGKTIRAAELAAAARIIEKVLKDNRMARPDLTNLENAWFRIESWYKEAGI